MPETILTNTKIILEDEVIDGTIVFDKGEIKSVDMGHSSLPSALDAEGDYVAPGLIEMHTDNMEKHFVPRPGVFWPDPLAAAVAHDAQMAAAGVTTVYDSICAGAISKEKDFRRTIFPAVMGAVAKGMETGAFRIDHRIHIRCELTGDDIITEIEPWMDSPLVRLGSLMDHTPGQRQWRNLEDLKRYNVGSGEKTVEEHERDVVMRMEKGPVNCARNWPLVVEMFTSRGIPIATHDDTTEADVITGVASGAVISEFPTTIEAAEAAHRHGLATIAGAPNVVRGGSHSGGVSATALAKLDLLDGLSSDYVPASLMQAVLTLSQRDGLALPAAMGMVTWRVADMLHLSDRGRLESGQRADIVRFRDTDGTPIVRALWHRGERAF